MSRPAAARLARALAVLLLLVLAWRPALVLSLLAPGMRDPLATLLLAALLVLLGVACAGLWGLRSWGFYAFYALVPFATFVHALALVPFLPSLLRPSARPLAIGLLNAALLLLVLRVHVALLDRSDQRGSISMTR